MGRSKSGIWRNRMAHSSVATLAGHSASAFDFIALLSGQMENCSIDDTLKVWDLAQPDGSQCVATLTGHAGRFCDVIVLPSGLAGVLVIIIRRCKVWDLAQPDGSRCVATVLTGHTGMVL